MQLPYLVHLQLKTNAAVVLLDTVNVNGVDLGAIVGKQSRQRATNNLGTVDDGDDPSMKAVAVGEDSVINSDILHDLDQSERCAGDDALLGVGLVQEANVVVHVVDVLVMKALDILAHIHDILEVLVLQVNSRKVERDIHLDVSNRTSMARAYNDRLCGPAHFLQPCLTWRSPKTG